MFFAGLARYSAIGLPYGSYGYDKAVQRYIWSTRKFIPTKYMAVIGVYTEEQFAECLADLSRIPRIPIHKAFLKLREGEDICLGQQQYLKSSFLYPAAPRCVHPVFEPNIDLAQFIDRHYRIIEEIGEYYVMERVQ